MKYYWYTGCASYFFFFQAEDGIRDYKVTGVQTCALPICAAALVVVTGSATVPLIERHELARDRVVVVEPGTDRAPLARGSGGHPLELLSEIGRASCRERV